MYVLNPCQNIRYFHCVCIKGCFVIIYVIPAILVFPKMLWIVVECVYCIVEYFHVLVLHLPYFSQT